MRATAALLTALDKPCRQMTITKRTGLLAICMRQLALGAAALALLAASTAAGAQSYTFSFLDGLGGSYSVANGINNAGQVVGFSYTTGNSTHATLWNGITPTALGGTDSVAFAINNAGQVVGYSGNHATIWNGTKPTLLYDTGYTSSWARGINNAGQVVGAYTGPSIPILWNGTTAIGLGNSVGYGDTATGINDAGQIVGDLNYGAHAVLWNVTTHATFLDDLGGSYSGANGINNVGQVVGYSGNHATIWNGTTPTALDGLSGGFSIAAAINNDGQVVGESQTTPGGAVHAILWNGTTPIDLNKYLDSNLANAGWFLSSANGINDIGSIVGQARTRPDGESRAYILSVTAVPEPQTYALMLAGLGMVCFATLRRKPANA